jgi:hypothetical protein
MKPDMEIGTPALSDPRETISPPDSEPATPQTSSTILTIPSSIPGESIVTTNAKFAEPIPRTAVIEAAEVPLPPSPPREKQSLPFRRPRVSNPLSRVVSDTARTPSGPGSGRRVSSALQYAMHPQLSPGTEAKGSKRVVSDASSSIDMDLAYYEQMKDEISSDSGSEEEIEGGAERPAWDSALGFGGQGPDFQGGEGEGNASLTGQEEDEAWMGYVRQQLNTLFPDCFEADAMSQRITGLANEQELEDEDGDVSVSTVATTELPTPVPRFGLSGVPNVRTEIGGLKDEIARLRSVVSDLAKDMRGPRPDVVTSGRGASVGTAGLEGTTQDQLPSEFVEVGRRLPLPKKLADLCLDWSSVHGDHSDPPIASRRTD